MRLYIYISSLVGGSALHGMCVANMQPYTRMQGTHACEMHGWCGRQEGGGAHFLTEALLPAACLYLSALRPKFSRDVREAGACPSWVLKSRRSRTMGKTAPTKPIWPDSATRQNLGRTSPLGPKNLRICAPRQQRRVTEDRRSAWETCVPPKTRAGLCTR